MPTPPPLTDGSPPAPHAPSTGAGDPAPPAEPRPRPAPRVWAAVVLAGLVLLLTAGGVRDTLQQRQIEDQRRFALLADELREELVERIGRYRRVLLGAGVFLGPAEAADRDAFRRAVAKAGLSEHLPAATGMGFVARVPAAEQGRFLAAMRADRGPGFRIHSPHPPQPGAARYVITSIEPASANAAAIGLDIARDPRRLGHGGTPP